MSASSSGFCARSYKQGDGVDAGDGERVRGDLGDPLTSSVDFEVPTDKALSILVTRLDEHAQPLVTYFCEGDPLRALSTYPPSP